MSTETNTATPQDWVLKLAKALLKTGEKMPDWNNVERDLAALHYANCVDALPRQERVVLHRLFGINIVASTPSEVGKDNGLSARQVLEVKREAIVCLKRILHLASLHVTLRAETTKDDRLDALLKHLERVEQILERMCKYDIIPLKIK